MLQLHKNILYIMWHENKEEYLSVKLLWLVILTFNVNGELKIEIFRNHWWSRHEHEGGISNNKNSLHKGAKRISIADNISFHIQNKRVSHMRNQKEREGNFLQKQKAAILCDYWYIIYQTGYLMLSLTGKQTIHPPQEGLASPWVSSLSFM